MKQALRKGGIDEKRIQQDGFCIGAFCKADDSPGDKEWFTEVLTALSK